jgi:predicted nucleic acid-binding protein
MLLRLGEAEVVELLVSSQVLEEIEDVIRRIAALLLPTLAVLLDRSRCCVVPMAPDDLTGRCLELVNHKGDAQILADAWHNQVDYLVTLDRAHFLDVPGLTEILPFPVGKPGDCLGWVRSGFCDEMRI